MYKTQYSDKCVCPYCGHEQEDIDIDGDTWGEEYDCEKCEGKFKYSLEITYDYTCEPIDGEGPEEIDGELGPKWIDPNQLNLFQGSNACSRT